MDNPFIGANISSNWKVNSAYTNLFIEVSSNPSVGCRHSYYNDGGITFDESNIRLNKHNYNKGPYSFEKHIYTIIFKRYFFRLKSKIRDNRYNAPIKYNTTIKNFRYCFDKVYFKGLEHSHRVKNYFKKGQINYVFSICSARVHFKNFLNELKKYFK